MKAYFKRLWDEKRLYALLFLGLISLGLFKIISEWKAPKPADLGIFTGFLLIFLVYFTPIIHVSAKNIKVKNPKPVFVEWGRVKMGVAYGIVALLTGGAFLAILALSEPLQLEVKNDTFIAGVFMIFALLSMMVFPVTLYMVYISTHYKRIVEYGTPEWRRLRRKK